MAELRSGSLSAVDDFFQWESESLIEVIASLTTSSTTHFLPSELLSAYFTTNSHQHLHDILISVFEPLPPPLSPELILRDHAAVFCILLSIGRGAYIEHFAAFSSLSDSCLPFDELSPPMHFPEAEDDPIFLERFCERQWMYCVPVFEGAMLHRYFAARAILPITGKEPLGIEGMAGRYLITVHESYNALIPVGEQKEILDGNTFILKRYPTKAGEVEYREEVNGFRSTEEADSIINYYGSYIHGEEFNILLEYADRGNLEDYFKRETPPSRGFDIVRFWEALFQLIDGLKVIHSVRGNHGDITTETIMVLSSGSKNASDCKFKFADFGLMSSRHEDILEALPVNGLPSFPTYSAPEYDASVRPNDHLDKDSMTWAGDIWSLGCVFSEAAIWIADGYEGLTDYRDQRRFEMEMTPLRNGDCFHDGEQVLQSVLDMHADIESRLRKSDYITKDVLDTMVDEMLWEEDRPTAKALWRKAEVVLGRAREKLDIDSPRPGSRQRRYSAPRLQPPTSPLPAIPGRSTPGLPAVLEKEPLNVEIWRSQVPASPGRSQGGGTDEPSSTTSSSNLDRELNGSIASWQRGGDTSPGSPVTPFSSPRVSVFAENQKHLPNEGRPRALRIHQSYEHPRPKNPVSRGLSFDSRNEPNEDFPPVAEARTMEEMRNRARAASRASSGGHSSHSSGSSIPPVAASPVSLTFPAHIPPKSQRRGAGFTLFPPNSPYHSPREPDEIHPALRPQRPPTPDNGTVDAIPKSVPSSISNSSVNLQPESEPDPSRMDYLSLNTCLEWKHAQKKAKKAAQAIRLPGAHMIEPLRSRDHAFIVDDSASMTPQWHDVKRVFEALSYLTKGMSADGTELFYTVSYDTYVRQNTSELCSFIDTKVLAGETDIAHRLKIQFQAYQKKVYDSRIAGKELIKRKKKGERVGEPLRPLSIYVLTDGEWMAGTGEKARKVVKWMGDWLRLETLPAHQVIVSFITFAQSQEAMRKLNDLKVADYGLDILDCEKWTGNVLRMLRGPMDKPPRTKKAAPNYSVLGLRAIGAHP